VTGSAFQVADRIGQALVERRGGLRVNVDVGLQEISLRPADSMVFSLVEVSSRQSIVAHAVEADVAQQRGLFGHGPGFEPGTPTSTQ